MRKGQLNLVTGIKKDFKKMFSLKECGPKRESRFLKAQELVLFLNYYYRKLVKSQ